MKYLTSSLIGVILLSLLLTTSAKSQTANSSSTTYINDTTLNFNNLINKFRGKLIYVDIWATWCGPCVHELRITKAVKGFQEFAIKNDIVILYICCDNNGKAWKSFISANKLAGNHILKNHKIDLDLHTTFSSVQIRQGKLKRSFYIPRHMIIDKNGMVADTTAGRQGSAGVYNKLTSMLNTAASR